MQFCQDASNLPNLVWSITSLFHSKWLTFDELSNIEVTSKFSTPTKMMIRFRCHSQTFDTFQKVEFVSGLVWAVFINVDSANEFLVTYTKKIVQVPLTNTQLDKRTDADFIHSQRFRIQSFNNRFQSMFHIETISITRIKTPWEKWKEPKTLTKWKSPQCDQKDSSRLKLARLFHAHMDEFFCPFSDRSQ